MKSIFYSAVIAFLLCYPQFSSQAQAEIYLSGSVAASQSYDFDVDSATSSLAEISFKPGYSLTMALGMGIDLDIEGRVEIEGGYNVNDVDEVVVGGGPTSTPGGELTTAFLMANTYHDYDIQSVFTPFFGLGAGIADITLNLENYGESSDTVFAYQAILGESYAITKNLNLELKYRYLGTTTVELTSKDATLDSYETDLSQHNIHLGLRYQF